jgi:hypothetical protein
MHMKQSYIAFRTYIKNKRKTDASDDVTRHSENDQMTYIACLRGTLTGWKFVVTKRGYVGIVPDLAQVGDIVAIMKGGCVPFLLKRGETRPGAVRLVGECYIHGIMDGQGIWLPGVVERRFRLY